MGEKGVDNNAPDWPASLHDLHVGALVVATPRGTKKPVEGQVVKLRDDATYDVLFEDGETDMHVKRQEIRTRTGELKAQVMLKEGTLYNVYFYFRKARGQCQPE